MRLRALPIALSATLCSAAAALLQAQAPNGFITVTQSRLLDVNGDPVANASVCATPSTSVKVANSGVTTMTQKCVQATNGAWTMFLPDGALSATLNAAFKITAIDNATRQQLLKGYDTVQPHSQTCSVVAGATTCTANASDDWCQGSACNFDQLAPSAPPNALIVQGQKGDAGAAGTPGPSGNTLAGTTSPEAYEAAANVTVTPGVTDETTYIQACLANGLYECVLSNRVYNFTTLHLPFPSGSSNGNNRRINFGGTGKVNGTVLKCTLTSAGDCFTMDAGPIQGVRLHDFDLQVPSTSGIRGMHFQPRPGNGYNYGFLSDSHIERVEIDTPGSEGLWLDGGGNAQYAGSPVQFLKIDQLVITGASQSHSAALFRATGQVAQTTCYNCSIGGDGTTLTNYPILIDLNVQPGSADASGTVRFTNSTVQGGVVGVNGYVAKSIGFDDGDFEGVKTPLQLTDVTQFSFTHNQIRNSGYQTGVVFAEGADTGVIAFNDIEAGASQFIPPYTCFGVNANAIDVHDNTSNQYTSGPKSSGCAGTQYVPAASMTFASKGALMQASTTPVKTVVVPVDAGKLFPMSALGQFVIDCTGNIACGGFQDAIPAGGAGTDATLTVPAGDTLQLSWDDQFSRYYVAAINWGIGINVPAFQTEVSDGSGGYFQVTSSGGVLYTIHCPASGSCTNIEAISSNVSGQIVRSGSAIAFPGPVGAASYTANGQSGFTGTVTNGACVQSFSGGILVATSGC